MFVALLCRHPRAILHVHAASRASFWRKSGFMAPALLARWPVVFHLHGGGFAAFYERECGPLRRALVRFFLGRAALYDLLQASLVLRRSLPRLMSLLEAMAAGCPVVATRVGGIPDLVAHGVNGLLVPPEDAVALAEAVHRVIANPSLVHKLGRAARATVAARFTSERSLERLGQVCAGLGLDTRARPFPACAVPRRASS